MTTSRQYYHMIDASGPCGMYDLTEDQVEKLHAKGWTLLPADPSTPRVKNSPTEHYHLVDSRGAYQGQRMLGQAEAKVMRELGWYLVHVGDASKDPDEVRAIKNLDKN